jgi:hypothetical protein
MFLVSGLLSLILQNLIPTGHVVNRVVSLLTRTKFEKFTSIVKKSKNFLWCKISKDLLNAKNDLFVCGVYIPPEKYVYFENEIFDELENDIIKFSSK